MAKLRSHGKELQRFEKALPNYDDRNTEAHRVTFALMEDGVILRKMSYVRIPHASWERRETKSTGWKLGGRYSNLASTIALFETKGYTKV